MGCGASRTAERQPASTSTSGSTLTATEAKPTATEAKPTDTVIAGANASVTVAAKRETSKQPSSKSTTPDSPTVTVKAWGAVDDGSLIFPEIDDPEFAIPALESDKLPIAICISGGGFRAAALALGWLRALHLLGVLKVARYLCTCSGSSWLSAALSFQQQVPLNEFLGPYLPPEECTLEALKNVGERGRSAAAVLADAEPLRAYLKGLAGLGEGEGGDGNVAQARSWTKAMAAAFLSPYGLGDTDNSTVTCIGTQGNVAESTAERAASVGRGNVFTADLKRLPFPIIAQVLLLPKERVKYFPLEWTPLYSGCPIKCPETSPKLGQGWVHTLGLNAHVVGQPEPIAVPQGAVRVQVRPAGPASLGEAIGISSAYNAYKWALGKNRAGRSVHRALGFNTAEYLNQQDWTTQHVELADGGGVDYLAIYPALRRKVPVLVVCSASRTRIDDPKFAFWMKELAALFGCWPGDPEADPDKELTAEEYNAKQQVLPREGFQELLRALKDTARMGLPPVHTTEYEVQENSALGIPGGWQVRIMWAINDRQPDWEASLPDDTRARLGSDRTGLLARVEEALNPLDADTLREFPHVSTFAMNYTPELVSLMANHAAHMLMGSKGAVRGLIAQAELLR